MNLSWSGRVALAAGLLGLLSCAGGCLSGEDTPCSSRSDCAGNQNCEHGTCQTVLCGGDKPFLVEGNTHQAAACAECREDKHCPTGERCSSTSNYSVYGVTPRCVPREGCDADDQCEWGEICVNDACVEGRRVECSFDSDCNDVEECIAGLCLSIQCPEETPFVGSSEGGRFCEECRGDEDCEGDQICQDWSRTSVYPVPGFCRDPKCSGAQDCRVDQTCDANGECVQTTN